MSNFLKLSFFSENETIVFENVILKKRFNAISFSTVDFFFQKRLIHFVNGLKINGFCHSFMASSVNFRKTPLRFLNFAQPYERFWTFNKDFVHFLLNKRILRTFKKKYCFFTERLIKKTKNVFCFPKLTISYRFFLNERFYCTNDYSERTNFTGRSFSEKTNEIDGKQKIILERTK